MNIQKNARLTPLGRERIIRQVESGQTPEAVAEAAGVCPPRVRKRVDRYRREGSPGLRDRSSRPHRLHRPAPGAIIETIERLRRRRRTGKQIAVEAGVSPATVSRVSAPAGLEQAERLGDHRHPRPGIVGLHHGAVHVPITQRSAHPLTAQMILNGSEQALDNDRSITGPDPVAIEEDDHARPISFTETNVSSDARVAASMSPYNVTIF